MAVTVRISDPSISPVYRKLLSIVSVVTHRIHNMFPSCHCCACTNPLLTQDIKVSLSQHNCILFSAAFQFST